jgi:hypothetical protein
MFGIKLALTMQSVNANVFFSCPLLGFNQSGCSVDAHDQTTGNLRIKGSRVTGLLYSKNPFNPSDNFVRARIGRFVEIENSAFNVLRQRPLQFESNILNP